MANIWAKDRRQGFYFGLALAGLAAIGIGFSTTYILPMAGARFSAPLRVHLHGLFTTSWVLLLLTQSLLARSGRIQSHMTLGQVAIPLGVAVWASGILTAAWAARRDLPEQGEIAFVSFFGSVTGLSIMLGFITAGYISRKRPAAHKRWLALATIAMLWPAVFRWRHLLPTVERPDILFGMLIANIPIVVAMLRDRFRYGAVHPVWLIGGTFWFVEQGLETILFDTRWSVPFGRGLLFVVP